MPLARLRLSTVGEDEEEVASTTDGGIEKVWIKTDAMIFFGRWSELIYEENGLRVWLKTEVFVQALARSLWYLLGWAFQFRQGFLNTRVEMGTQKLAKLLKGYPPEELEIWSKGVSFLTL